MVEELELRCAHLRGRLTSEVPELAIFRRNYRAQCYSFADRFFALSLFHLIVASAGFEPARTFCLLGFCVAFPMMFWSEFGARAMTRQLKRRAAEQLLRDVKGLRG